MPKEDTLTIETECRGNLIATLQETEDGADNNTVEITGHLVPEDKSTGKVFFEFTYNSAKDTYDCELLPKKALLSFKKLTGKDDDIIAEITSNLKESIYEAKHKEFDSMHDTGKDKTPPKTNKTRRKSTDASSSEKKKRAKPKITPAGKVGQDLRALFIYYSDYQKLPPHQMMLPLRMMACFAKPCKAFLRNHRMPQCSRVDAGCYPVGYVVRSSKLCSIITVR